MRAFKKKIVLDQDSRPVGVLLEYEDWLEIERILAPLQESEPQGDLSRFAGTLSLKEDPLAYQQACRDEWP